MSAMSLSVSRYAVVHGHERGQLSMFQTAMLVTWNMKADLSLVKREWPVLLGEARSPARCPTMWCDEAADAFSERRHL